MGLRAQERGGQRVSEIWVIDDDRSVRFVLAEALRDAGFADHLAGRLQHLIDQTDGLPLALVMTSRPALLSRRPAWGPAGALLPLCSRRRPKLGSPGA